MSTHTEESNGVDNCDDRRQISQVNERDDGDDDFNAIQIPKSTPWHQSISYDAYAKLLDGFAPVSMDDRWIVICDKADASTGNRGLAHVYFSWNDEEEVCAELFLNEGSVGDPVDKSAAYATSDKISWEASDQYEGFFDEENEKDYITNMLRNVVGIDLTEDNSVSFTRLVN